MLTGNKA